jgi:tetratricopeptide (TPR) repeat protein
VHDIRRRFESSTDFNEIFEAFEHALRQRLDDIELYRQLFWNPSLSPDELRLFGEKLSHEHAHISYDVYMWLAGVFEATTSTNDNYELAVEYYRKAARSAPVRPEPYLYAADCYEPDLNIPPIAVLINFLKEGTQNVPAPKLLFQRLSHLYDSIGNDEMAAFCKRKAQEGTTPQDAPPEL